MAFKELLKPILYADIFDYPLTGAEIYRFLECKTSRQQVDTQLAQSVADGQLLHIDGYYCLPNRAHLIAKRKSRSNISHTLWLQATRHGQRLARLPFVRMVAVTGALAVNNPRDDVDDIDYLIVTQTGRLWLCRAMIITLVRVGHLQGVHLCPNYIITENALDFEPNFFVAREMLQMQPVYGRDVYLNVIERNNWTTRYFPQGGSPNLGRLNGDLPPGARNLKKLAETALAGVPGDRLERWLQKKQVDKQTRRAQMEQLADTVVFSADVCKGHYDGHSSKTMDAYRQRLQQYTNGKVDQEMRTR